MAKISDVRMPSNTRRSRVLLDPKLADLFRRVCKYVDKDVDQLFSDMLALYLQQKTDLEVVFEAEPEDGQRA